MRDSYEYDGWEIPKSRQLGVLEGQRRAWNPAVDANENVVMECYMLPMDFIEIIRDDRRRLHVTTNDFLVKVLGEVVGFSKVEFPTLDAMSEGNIVALVKLYRAKLERKENK